MRSEPANSAVRKYEGVFIAGRDNPIWPDFGQHTFQATVCFLLVYEGLLNAALNFMEKVPRIAAVDNLTASTKPCMPPIR